MIQIIALVTMLIDHIGVIIDEEFFRMVGRLSMPCFAFLIAYNWGFVKDKSKYFYRVVLLSAFSQLGFSFTFRSSNLNICFSWAVALMLLYLRERCNKIVWWLSCVISSILCVICNFDYGCIAVLWVLMWYAWLNCPDIKFKFGELKIFGLFFIWFGSVGFSLLNLDQLYSCWAVPLIYILYDKKLVWCKNKIFRYVYRWFYPVHLLILGCFV